MNENPERDLWQAVIERAIVDALWPAPKYNDGSGVRHLDQHQARKWFRTRHFEQACNLAGYAPEFIRDRIVPLFDASPKVRGDWLKRMSNRGYHLSEAKRNAA